MKARLSLQMTLLGLGVMVFYGGLLASGQVTMEILPHYAISAVIFPSPQPTSRIRSVPFRVRRRSCSSAIAC